MQGNVTWDLLKTKIEIFVSSKIIRKVFDLIEMVVSDFLRALHSFLEKKKKIIIST